MSAVRVSGARRIRAPLRRLAAVLERWFAFDTPGNVVRANARFVHVESGEVLQAMRADVLAPPSKPEKLLELQDKLAEDVNRSVPEVVQRLRK